MKSKHLFLALGLLIASGMMVLNAKNVAHEGTFKGGTWTVYDDGELRIARSSNGAIPDYQDSYAPWASYAEEIKWINLDESKGKITRIGKWAFRDMEVDSIKQGNRPANHLELESLGKKAFNSFNVREGLYISGNKEMSRHTAISATPFLSFKDMETVWEYGLSGSHAMIDLGPDIKMLKAGSLKCNELWHIDGTPSIFMQATTPPEWQRIVNQGESHASEWIAYIGMNILTGGITYWISSDRAGASKDAVDANSGYTWAWAYGSGANFFITESDYEYPFGDKPQGYDGEILVVVPPDLWLKYCSAYQSEHPEVGYGYLTAYYTGEHSKKTYRNTTSCGRFVRGEPLYDKNGNFEGWWYADKQDLHIGFVNEVPSYAENKAPWAEYLNSSKNLYIHNAKNIADDAFYSGKNLDSIENIYLDKTVESIGKRAFLGCDKVEWVGKITSTPSVKVGDSAFKGCTNLANISDVDIRSFGESSFENCSKIYGVKSPYHLSTFPKRVFYGCSKLHDVDLTKAETIGEEAFAYSGMTKVALNSICTIGKSAFLKCSQLEEVHFGAGKKTLGDHAFNQCERLLHIFVESANYGEVIANAGATTYDYKLDEHNKSTITLHIDPDYYLPYEKHQYYNLMKVDKVFTFPAIGNISGGLLTWELTGDGTLTITPTVYQDRYDVYGSRLEIPDYESPEKQPWYTYREYIKAVMLKSAVYKGQTYGITKIGKNAFAYPKKGESQITDIHIPRTCKEIHEAAFRNNDQLVSIYIDDVEEIGSFAFENCEMLYRIDLGASFSKGGDYIFRNCPKLNAIDLKKIEPAEITKYTFAAIGNTQSPAAPRRSPAAKGTADDGQQNVTLNVPAGGLNNYLVADYWKEFNFDIYDNTHGKLKASGKFGDGTWILYEDSAMIISANRDLTSKESTSFGETVPKATKSIIFQGNLTSVGKERAYLFTGFDNLVYVSLPSNVKRIGANCFENCAKLSEVTLGNVDTIDTHAFGGCGFEAVSLASAKEVGSYAFEKCLQLRTVTVGSETQLGLAIFRGCTALKTADLGGGKLGNNMFWDCLNLAEVTYSGAELPSGVFDGCVNLNILRLGTQLNKIGAGAFNKCDKLDTIYISTPQPSIMEATVQINDYPVVDDDLRSYSADRANPFGVVITGSHDEIIRWGYYIDHKKIHVVVPELYAEAYRKADLWKEMIINNYASDDMEYPITFAIGKKTSGIIDDKGNLKIVAYGDMDGNASAVSAWASYIKNIEFDYPVSSTLDAADAANGLFAWMTQAPKSITFGALTKTVGAYGFYSDAIGPDVVFNCYAATPPTIYAKAFNWDVLTPSGKKPTLHVLKDAAVVEAYKNAPGWYRFNIVGDLTKQSAPTQYTVTFIDGSSQSDVPVVIDEQIVDLGMSAVAPKAPACVGYVFDGWDGDYTNVTEDRMIIALYTYTTHTVNFYAYGQEVWESQTVEHGAAARIPEKTPAGKGNIIFDHWGWSSNMDSVIRDLNCNAMFKQNVPVTKIDVEPNLKPYTINKSELGKKTVQLTATVLPTNALNKDVVWSTEKEEVATVDQNGLVTFKGFGECFIYATAADGSGVSDYVWVIIYNEEEVIEPVYATNLDLEQKEVTILLNQDPKLVYFTVTPANYNGGISFIPRGEMHTQIMQISSEGQNAPAVYLNADEGLKQKQNFTGCTDTIDFRAGMFDPQVTQHAPQVRMIVHIRPDSIFTENSIEGVPVTYRVVDLDNKICEVYGERKMLMMPNPETGLPFEDVPAIPVTTTGKVTIPGSVRGFTVLRTHENAFIGCKQLEEVEFENGFQQFGASSFAECDAMKTIRLPKSLKRLEPFCATGLQNVTNVYIRAAEPPIGWQRMIYENEIIDLSETHAFENVNANAVLHVIKESKALFNVAPWTEWFKTISDDLDGAYVVRFVDYDGTELSNQTVEYDGDAIAPVDPFHQGREFIGWDKAFTHVLSNLTVTAQYNVTKYTVTFVDWNGAKLQETQAEYGESVNAPADPRRNGYVFKGWDKTFDNITENTTVTAVYAKLYTVSFIDWDGTELKSESVEEGNAAHEPLVPMRAGYRFTGWDTDFYNVLSDLIVQAQYAKETQGVENVQKDEQTPKVRKVLINGYLYILRQDGAIFNASGVRVK